MSRRAMAPMRSRQRGGRVLPEPGITAALARVILGEFERRGLASGRLLARSGLSREQVMRSGGWIPIRAHAAFFRLAVEASGDPAFAWVVGRITPPEVLGAVGSAVSVSSTMREGLETWARFFHLHADGARLSIRSTPAFDAISWELPPAFPAAHDNCLSFAAAVLAGMERSLGPVRPLGIDVTGAAPAGAAGVEGVVGAPIRWGADRFELRIPPGILDRRLAAPSPSLRARLVRMAEQDDATHSTTSTARRVRATILREGLDRASDIVRVANLLGTTPRTLQRWLREEGLSFTEVRDEMLAEAARRMLSEDGAPVAVAARRLGFSSRTAFQRFVKRWSGKTPGELRQEGARRVSGRPRRARQDP